MIDLPRVGRLTAQCGRGAVLLLLATAPAVSQTLDDADLARLAGYAEDAFVRSGVPGLAMAVVENDEVVLSRTLGVREAGMADPVTGSTVFPLASVSKTFASAFVAAMVADGHVRWDDALSDHMAGFRLMDAAATLSLSLRDGLSHRSGLPHHAGDELEPFGYDRATIIERLRFLPPVAPFRTSFAYQNYVLTAAAAAAAQAGGGSFEDMLETRLLRPVGMTATSARHDDFLARRDRVALHVRRSDSGAMVPGPAPNSDRESPAAGISASIDDMTRWLRFQLAAGTFDGQTVVDPAALSETHAPQTIIGVGPGPAPATFYGLGWFVLRYPDVTVLFHDGALEEGANTLVMLVPEREVGLVVLTNAFPVGLATAIGDVFVALVRKVEPEEDPFDVASQAIADAIAQAYTSPPPPAPADRRPRGPDDRYTGTYRHPYFGEVSVESTNGALTLGLGMASERRRLVDFDADILVDAEANRFVRFLVGAEGRATHLVRQPRYAQEEEAVFTRVD